MNTEDRLVLNPLSVEIAESNGTDMMVRFVICDFGDNKNKVRLNRDTIENWVATLKNKPLVGKVVNGDFTGHNVRTVTRVDEDGRVVKEIEFDTSAFGTFVDVGIEEIDKAECIVATAEVWRRYPRVCKLIESRVANGTLASSFEIMSKTSHVDGDIKVVDDGEFMGHCCLGKNVIPAYDSSRALEVAEQEGMDEEMKEAIEQDIVSVTAEAETTPAEDAAVIESAEQNDPVQEEAKPEAVADGDTDGEPTEPAEPEQAPIETSAITDFDLRKKLNAACKGKLDKWCWVVFVLPMEFTCWCEYEGRESELDYAVFTYEVIGDDVVVSEPAFVQIPVSIAEVTGAINSRDSALATANDTIQTLRSEVEKLTPYRDAAEKAERERIEAERAQKREEMIAYAKRSNLFAEADFADGGEIAQIISELDESKLHSIIGKKFLESIAHKEEAVVTSSVDTATIMPATILPESDGSKSFIRKYING